MGLIRGGEKPNVVAQECTATLLRRDLPGEVQKQVFGELLEIAEKAASGACKVRVEEIPVQGGAGGGKAPAYGGGAGESDRGGVEGKHKTGDGG